MNFLICVISHTYNLLEKLLVFSATSSIIQWRFSKYNDLYLAYQTSM